MIISVASGKGGTGKTTIATNLAFSLGEDVQILDCDVEEPNVHLFIKPEIETADIAETFVPKVNLDQCSLCGACADVCRFSAITVVGDTVLTFPELCHGCRGCMLACREGAVTSSSRELGVIERGHRGNLDFVQGRLRIGEAMAPPLINKVKTYFVENQVKIVDAPPGTSCPVITAIKHTDFVLMVTEPTPFGLHDLKLAVEAVRTMEIPFGLVINRADVGDDKVAQYAQAEKIPILMEIPFKREIAEIYSNGGLLVEEQPQWRKSFIEMFEKIEQLIN